MKDWLPYRKICERPRLRLFCFPFAGGAASIFRDWQSQLSDDIEVCAVQLPGREMRLRETPLVHMDDVVEKVCQAITPLIGDIPHVFFGHSMGALVAFEVARMLRPEHLFLSGFPAPWKLRARQPIHQMAEAELVEMLRSLGGTQAGVFQRRDLLNLILPTVRADFQVVDTYQIPTPLPKLAVDVSVLGGVRDTWTPSETLNAWKDIAGAHFELQLFEGGHFFISTSQQEVLRYLHTSLNRFTMGP